MQISAMYVVATGGNILRVSGAPDKAIFIYSGSVATNDDTIHAGVTHRIVNGSFK